MKCGAELVIRFNSEEVRDGRDCRVSWKTIAMVMDGVERALYFSDRTDVQTVARKLGMNRVMQDACLERIRRHRYERFQIRKADNGSIVFYGAITAVSFFVLKNTIGESLKEGWRISKRHQRLTEVFRSIFDEKVESIADSIRDGLLKLPTAFSIALEQVGDSAKDKLYRIVVDVQPGGVDSDSLVHRYTSIEEALECSHDSVGNEDDPR